MITPLSLWCLLVGAITCLWNVRLVLGTEFPNTSSVLSERKSARKLSGDKTIPLFEIQGHGPSDMKRPKRVIRGPSAAYTSSLNPNYRYRYDFLFSSSKKFLPEIELEVTFYMTLVNLSNIRKPRNVNW